ncbi:Fibroblast growth factor receptor substrate 2 like protein [Argiope bruennichi]|uniref:Fibroblast growth factor receptor substrate 2 like protein n=1 Tax=Argiope bruennichi TaxID=94029 RepID=A0A8T0EUP8_ARGBR|nr:Fibroblast growth factor receptor substrate 2 like protein [Argiope bruennichi]
MGCAFSKAYENNPRIFHVWNVDSDGRHLKPGKIEVTDTQLILYQKTNIVVRWPLTSLRRYGFDSEVFSFECGRRCTTGAGVYAFKCRRAQALFSILQESINNSSSNAASNTYAEEQTTTAVTNTNAESVNPIHSTSPAVQNGHILNMIPTSPTVDAFGYLQPNPANNFVHFQPPTPAPRHNSTAGSPGGYICIQGTSSVSPPEGMTTEWPSMPSNLPSCCSLGTCGGRSISASPSAHHYVNNEVIEQGASCSNTMCIMNKYVNHSVIAADLTHRCCPVTRCCVEHNNKSTYVNSAMVTLSTGHLPCSGGICPMDCAHCLDLNTNYAKLDDLLKQEQSAKKHKEHYYVNVKTDATAHSSSTSSKCVSGRSSPIEALSRCGTLTTPTSPNSTQVLKSHCYANLGSPTTSETASSKEQIELTYAVLDLYQSDSSNNNVASPVSTQNSLHSLASSPVKSPEGYAQIDFDKTVALSNSANPCAAFNDDSMRKTRHNAVTPGASMTV